METDKEFYARVDKESATFKAKVDAFIKGIYFQPLHKQRKSFAMFVKKNLKEFRHHHDVELNDESFVSLAVEVYIVQ